MNKETMQKELVHEQVSQAYTEALRRSQTKKGSCCSSAPVEPAGVAAKLAGYTDEVSAHADAAESSFGCGNPLAFAGVQPGQTVLDLGSGAGFDLLIAADRVGGEGRVIGVDMTDDMLEAARANAANSGHKNIELRKGIIEELPVEDNSVDWVISNCVVNLSPDKARVFAEIARVLKPGGRFSISDIVAEDLPQELREMASAHAACIGGAISESDYVAGLNDAGLRDVTVDARQTYDAAQIQELVACDFDLEGESAQLLAEQAPALEGKVASLRFTGRN